MSRKRQTRQRVRSKTLDNSSRPESPADELIRQVKMNSLTDLVTSMSGAFPDGYNSEEVASPFTLGNANAYTPLSLNRILLSYSYMTIGLIQTIVDQPVEDAFRGGVTLHCKELSPEENNDLRAYMDDCNDFKQVKDAAKWARLYGGAGLVLVTDQNPKAELRPIAEGDPLEFVAADRWELILSNLQWATPTGNPPMSTDKPYRATPHPYNYYGKELHTSRVIRMLGREAPSFIRLRLQGWGMSEIERCIRPINSFLKLESVIFELIDEAKIDVYQIEGFNMQLATPGGTDAVTRRIQLANMLKNYKRALVMDKEDGYSHKQMGFGGLAEMYEQSRINLCAALKMPATKLWGQSAQGFSTGAEDIENYNTVVEGDIRHPIRPMIAEAAKLRCAQKYGFTPETIEVRFKPLRADDSLKEEQVRASQVNRATALFDRNLLTGQETMHLLRQEGCLLLETEVGRGEREPETEEPDNGYKKTEG